jgi:drug/metabolite transporter (DMT)-like permease
VWVRALNARGAPSEKRWGKGLDLGREPALRTVSPICMSSTARAEHYRAILGLLLANLCWGLSFPLVKALLLLQAQLVPHAGTWFSTALVLAPRFVLAAAVLAVGHLLLGRSRGITRLELRQGVILGLFAAGGMLLQSDGLQFTAASTSAFLTQLYAVLIPLYLAWRTRRSPGRRIWLAVVLVLAGVAILGRFDWRELRLGRGEWETLLCSLFFMGQILWLERREFAGNRAVPITLVMFATEGIIFSGLVLATMPDAAALTTVATSGWWLVYTGGLTLICTIGAYLLMNTWQPKITATEAGLIYCVEPIFGSLMALFLPAWFSIWSAIAYANETATWTLLVGGGLITVANVVVQLRPPPPPGPPAVSAVAR